jgi:hypothetical protein
MLQTVPPPGKINFTYPSAVGSGKARERRCLALRMLWCYNKTLRGRLFIALFVALKGFSSIMLKKRLARLRGRIYSQGLDGLIVSLPAHRRYLSGFTPDDGQWGETSGWLFITAYHAVLLTDFRYELSAPRTSPAF